MNKRQLVRVKKLYDAGSRLQDQWEELLSNEGFSMNRGLNDKLSYVGTSEDLGVMEKLQESAKGN